MEQSAFLDRIKSHVTTDFLRGILLIFAVSKVYFHCLSIPMCIHVLSSVISPELFTYDAWSAWGWLALTLASFVVIFFEFLVFAVLMVMLFLNARHSAKFALVVLTVLLVFHVVATSVSYIVSLSAPGHYLPMPPVPIPIFVINMVHICSQSLFLIVCAVWLRKGLQSEPCTETLSFWAEVKRCMNVTFSFLHSCAVWLRKKLKRERYDGQHLWERVKHGVTSELLRGILFAFAAMRANDFIFAFIRYEQTVIGGTWNWMAYSLFITLVYCTAAVALFMQIRRCAKFVLAALVGLLVIDVWKFFWELFVYTPNIDYVARKWLQWSLQEWWWFMQGTVVGWFPRLFFIALAAWFYAKSKAAKTRRLSRGLSRSTPPSYQPPYAV